MIIWENIGVGRIEQMDRQDLVVRSAERSLADTVATRLKGGMDQQLGRRFDGGVELSGGEWQKVALARAYMREAQELLAKAGQYAELFNLQAAGYR